MGRIFFSFGLILLLTACSSSKSVDSYLIDQEKALGTSTEATKIMHSVVDFPRGIGLHFPGYVVGIEKSPRDRVTTSRWQRKEGESVTRHLRIPYEERRTRLIADGIYNHSKAHIISHIMSYDMVPSGGKSYQRMTGCALYNLYENDKANARIECQDHLPGLQGEMALKTAFDHSWKALGRLDQSIAARFRSKEAPTHIIVYVMGWNTPQEEAVRNFNSLGGHLMDAAEEGANFRPLIIGVTWPSLWRGVTLIPDFVTQPLSYRNKANDADEVGMTWLGVLLHDILPKYRDRAPVVAVGHSFGARALTRAVFTGPAIAPDARTAADNNKNNVVDLVIALQGAFSKNRFLPKNSIGREDQPYDKFRAQADQVLLTASTYDTAVDTGFWVDAAGNEKSWNAECKDGMGENNKIFDCRDLKDKKDFTAFLRDLPDSKCAPDSEASCRIRYLKLDPIIRFNAAYSGGNAHSDIYRAPIGKLTWEAICKYARGKHTSCADRAS